MTRAIAAALVVSVLCGASAANPATTPAADQRPVLRLATTTSTVDTGLLGALLPAFEQRCGCRVDVVAAGTGQALEIGRRGDADVLLVHARKAEDRFVAERHARERFGVMYNDFVIVGPDADPAKTAGLTLAREAFTAVARAGAPFVSRGDRSGTHTVELAIWADLKIAPAGAPWYRAVGQGMGESLVVANEQRAYALTDRATWLAMSAKLPALRLLVGGSRLSENKDQDLRNDYGVLAVNPDIHPGVNHALAASFIEWLLSADTQRAIGRFGADRFGQPLYYPDSDQYKATRELSVTIGGRTTTFTLADLRALPKVVLARHAVVGVKKGPVGAYTPPAARSASVLAYDRDGKPIGGAAGLIQLVVGPDEFAGRYSHWVNTIVVVPPAGR